MPITCGLCNVQRELQLLLRCQGVALSLRLYRPEHAACVCPCPSRHNTGVKHVLEIEFCGKLAWQVYIL